MSKINRENYLKAVKSLKSDSDIEIGRKLKKDRSSIHRFKRKYPDVEKEGKEILNELAENISGNVYSSKIDQWEYFNNLPIIVEWRTALSDDRVTTRRQNIYLRGFWHVCKELRVHPDKADVLEVAELVKEAKRKYYVGEKMKRGLAYTSIRECVRSFYTRMKMISGEYLAQIGVTKEASLGQGKYSKQRIPQKVRHILAELIMMDDKLSEYEKIEALYANKLMYYYGNRVESILGFSFEDRPFTLNKEKWEMTVLDKGEYGGKEWSKELIDFALEDFKEYCSKRFNIAIDDLETELPNKTDKLFPIMTQDKLREINKRLLPKAGLSYKDFPPNHIFRHTFAQDALRATDHNYELVAELGGWESSETLKRHYGEIDERAKSRGLRKLMGLPVEKIKDVLEW